MHLVSSYHPYLSLLSYHPYLSLSLYHPYLSLSSYHPAISPVTVILFPATSWYDTTPVYSPKTHQTNPASTMSDRTTNNPVVCTADITIILQRVSETARGTTQYPSTQIHWNTELQKNQSGYRLIQWNLKFIHMWRINPQRHDLLNAAIVCKRTPNLDD